MKKLITFLIILIATGTLSAQITITPAQLPFAGLGYINAKDTSYTGTVPSGGASQNWNFASLLTQDDTDTLDYLSAASTPFTADFPTSNLARQNATDRIYYYFTSDSNGFYLNGGKAYGLPDPFGNSLLVYNPAEMYLPVPFTYGDTLNAYYRFVVDMDTALPYMRWIFHANQTHVADGWGSLTLPNSTYANTLRVKYVQTVYDTLLTDVMGFGMYIPVDNSAAQYTMYTWLRTQQPSIVLTVFADSLGTTAINADYFEGTAVTGISETTNTGATNVSVYPNPASELVTVLLPAPGTAGTIFRMTDIGGRVIRETSLDGIFQYSFYVNHLQKGVYTWTVGATTGRLMVR